MARVWDDVGSGNGIIRLSLFGSSAFLSNRYPTASVCESGTGLATPVYRLEVGRWVAFRRGSAAGVARADVEFRAERHYLRDEST